MALEIGPVLATIKTNTVRDINGKTAVVLKVETAKGDFCDVMIFITEKSYAIARRQLKLAGFSIDDHELDELVDDKLMLSGNNVALFVEEYNGKLRAAIDTQVAPEKSRLKRATEGMRSAKSKAQKSAEPVDDAPPHDDDDLPF